MLGEPYIGRPIGCMDNQWVASVDESLKRTLNMSSISVTALQGIPLVQPGDDLATLLIVALEELGIVLRRFDILVVAQKVVSKAEDRFLDLATFTPSLRARELAEVTRKDKRLLEAILQESTEVVRVKPGVIVVETRHGFVMANAGIDQSNLSAEDHGRRVLLLPADPQASAERLKSRIDAHFGSNIGLIISDSVGRAWRLGTVGLAIGAAGIPSLRDQRGEPDLSGRVLEATETGFADAVAAAGVLVMGEAAEGYPAVLVRGLDWTDKPTPASALIRPKSQDLFR